MQLKAALREIASTAASVDELVKQAERSESDFGGRLWMRSWSG
jgi:hypothetical protein